MSYQPDLNWFMPIRVLEDALCHVFCYPHGGGAASWFHSWKKLGVKANIFALKLPGRESRIREAPVTACHDIIPKMLEAIPSESNMPVIFYGHSMGAGLAFELIRHLSISGRQIPEMLIASGRQAPHIADTDPVKNLSDDELLQYMTSLGGISRTLSDNTEFLKFYLPKIRADYQLNASIPIPTPSALDIKIALINGQDDKFIEADRIGEWQQYSTSPIVEMTMPGGHFFMEDDQGQDMIQELIRGQVSP